MLRDSRAWNIGGELTGVAVAARSLAALVLAGADDHDEGEATVCSLLALHARSLAALGGDEVASAGHGRVGRRASRKHV